LDYTPPVISCEAIKDSVFLAETAGDMGEFGAVKAETKIHCVSPENRKAQQT